MLYEGLNLIINCVNNICLNPIINLSIFIHQSGIRLTCNIIVAPVRNESGEVRLYILTFQSDMENNRLHSFHSPVDEKER